MIKYIFVLTFYFLSIPLFAQDKESRFKRGDTHGKISGIVFEKETNQPVEAASVKLIRLKDSTHIFGTHTNVKGEFLLENLSYGKFIIEISLIGYSKTTVSGIMITPQSFEIKLDTVFLKSGNQVTEEIDVTGERSQLQLGLDKKIFTIGKDLNLEGGNATDVLKRVPSVTVDVDGNVSLRGSTNIKILIDGKPAMLSAQNKTQILEQIPASSIESIELITNPSAKYDPEGESGIINIVLKKNTLLGYNGNFSLSAGTRDKYNGSVNLNLRNSLVNIFGNYNFRLFNMNMYGNSNRQNTAVNNPSVQNQYTDADMRMLGHMIKGGADYYLSDFHTLGISSTYNYRFNKRNETILGDNYDSIAALYSHTNSDSYSDGNGYGVDVSLNYTGKFKTPKQFLTGEITYSRNKDKNHSSTVEKYLDLNFVETSSAHKRNSITDFISDVFNIQFDYTHPFRDQNKLEAGYRTLIRLSDNDYFSETFDTASGQFISDINLNNRFKLNEQIHAIYGIYSGKLGFFNYQLGARLEQTNTRSELVTTSQSFNKNYFSVFPSINLSYKFSLTDEIHVGYTKRINRPSLRDLNPFTDYSDPQNLRTGNPDLNPEYIDSYELNYLKYIDMTSVSPSVFFKQTHDGITRYRYLTDSNITITTFKNLTKIISYGFEIIASSQITDWWSMNGSVSYFKTKVNGENIEPDLNNSGYSWTAKLNSSMKLWHGVEMQVAYNYQGKRITVLGEMSPHQTVDVAFKKDFMDKRMSLSLRLSDIFKTHIFKVSLSNTGFNQNFERNRDSQNVFLTFTYRFGTQTKDMMSRQKKREDEDNRSNDVDY